MTSDWSANQIDGPIENFWKFKTTFVTWDKKFDTLSYRNRWKNWKKIPGIKFRWKNRTFFGHFWTRKSKKYLDVSPNESLFIKNGESCIEIFDPELSEVRRSISTTTAPQVAKFFPSGQVILIADHNVLRIADVGSGTVVRNRRSS